MSVPRRAKRPTAAERDAITRAHLGWYLAQVAPSIVESFVEWLHAGTGRRVRLSAFGCALDLGDHPERQGTRAEQRRIDQAVRDFDRLVRSAARTIGVGSRAKAKRRSKRRPLRVSD